MMDHSSFLVESVICVIEVKSTYSRDELDQCFARAEQLRSISIGRGGAGFRPGHDVQHLWAQVLALRDGVQFSGMTISEPRIAYGAIFLMGGETISLVGMFESQAERIHDAAPDFIAFMTPGIFVRRYEPNWSEWKDGETPTLILTRPGENVLISVASEVLRAIQIRSPAVEGMWDLGPYDPAAFDWDETREERLDYRLTHSPPGYAFYYDDGTLDEESGPDV